MGYWSTHPMGGDSPCDAQSFILDYIFEKEGMTFEDDGYFCDLCAEKGKKLIDKYKYEMMDNIKDILTIKYENYTADYTDCSFALPFLFLDYDIRVKKDYIDKIIELLSDGGASERGYYEEDEEDSPIKVINLIKKYKDELFSEDYTTEKAIEIIPREEISQLFDMGLLATIDKAVSEGKTGLVNKD